MSSHTAFKIVVLVITIAITLFTINNYVSLSEQQAYDREVGRHQDNIKN
jgi:hypothetical protein